MDDYSYYSTVSFDIFSWHRCLEYVVAHLQMDVEKILIGSRKMLQYKYYNP